MLTGNQSVKVKKFARIAVKHGNEADTKIGTIAGAVRESYHRGKKSIPYCAGLSLTVGYSAQSLAGLEAETSKCF